MIQSKYTPERIGEWGTPATADATGATDAAGSGYATATLTLADGVPLFYRRWLVADARAPVLVLLHGLGAHSGWFIDMGNNLSALGLHVYVPDHRGFGRSGGPRGHVTDGQVYLRDITTFVGDVRQRHDGRPVFVLGHSMGAVFALHFAAADARNATGHLAGLLLLNPWIANPGMPPVGTQLAIVLGGLRKSSRLLALAGGTDVMTTNDEAIQMLGADTYWVRQESASFFYQVGLRLRGAAIARARDVRVPALVLQAENDRSVILAASRKAFDALGSQDKTWKTYPGYAHDSEFEADRTALDADIAAWVKAH